MIFFVLLYHQTDFLLLMRINFSYRIVEEEKILYSNIFHILTLKLFLNMKMIIVKNVVRKSIRYHPPPIKKTHPYKYCHTYTHLWRRWIKFTPPCSYLKKVASELWKRWLSTNSFAKLIIFQNNIEAWEVLCFTLRHQWNTQQGYFEWRM